MAGREGGLGARSRGLRLLSSPQAQDGGLDSGLGTCSPTSEDRGIASSLGVAEGVDWLDAVVERLQTVFVIRGEGERREGGKESPFCLLEGHRSSSVIWMSRRLVFCRLFTCFC